VQPDTHNRARRRRRPTATFAPIAALLVACVVAVLVVLNATPAGNPREARGPLPRTAAVAPAVAERPVTAPSSTTTTSTTTTPPPPPEGTPQPPGPLSTPEDVPDPAVRRPIQIIGRIQIPTIALDAELRDQITQQSIDLGPSHWPGTAGPGGFGNAVIAGHRNSYTAPFHDLGALHPGDPIVLVDAAGQRFTYHVTELFVVSPDATWIADQAPGHTLTLFTCHPIGSAAQRLVVRATLG